jgi:hypothetical protein
MKIEDLVDRVNIADLLDDKTLGDIARDVDTGYEIYL